MILEILEKRTMEKKIMIKVVEVLAVKGEEVLEYSPVVSVVKAPRSCSLAVDKRPGE
jgi:hypothetical protein